MSEEKEVEGKADNTLLIVLISVGLVLIGVFGFKWLMGTKPEAKKTVQEVWTPSVRVVLLEEKDYTPVIRAEGEVEAGIKTMLISEVTGALVYISPNLEKGNVFSEGEVIVKVDAADYETQLTSNKSVLADAELALAQERARAVQAARDWKKLGRGGAASDLVLRKPQIKSALARIDAAEAAIAKSERDLAKTVIRAPYRCMVDRKFIDQGAYLGRLSKIAEVSSVDEYEVRLPLNLNEVGYLGESRGIGSEVLLESSIGGKIYRWKGRAVRFEGGVDSSTFSMVMVVRVERNGEKGEKGDERFQLPPVGMFLRAEVRGERMGKVYSVPREAMREGGTIWQLAAGDVLRIVDVRVIRGERDEVMIGMAGGSEDQLAVGDRVIVSPIAIPLGGMKLELEKVED